MKRVLIITSNFPRWEGDPHSPWLLALMARLQARGYTFEVMAPAFRGQGAHYIGAVPVHRFRYAPAAWEILTHEDGAPNKLARQPWLLLLLPGYMLSGLLLAWRLGGSGHFDVIHVHWPLPQGLFGLLARWRSRARLVTTLYGSGLVLARRFPGLNRFLRFFARRCDAVAAISDFTARQVQAVADVTPAVIPYGVAVPPLQTYPSVPGRILVVGRLIPRKGHSYLLRALARLHDVPDAHLVVVGEGQERPGLERLCAELGLQQRVQFTGRVPDAELQQLYQSCQIFVLPAIVDDRGDTEMLGMVVPEAMRYGKPVIVTDVGGLVDTVVAGESGLVVPQMDVEALAAALRALLLDADLAERLGRAGYEAVRAKFSWSAVLAAVQALYGGEG